MRSKLISVLSFVGLIFAFLVPAQPVLSATSTAEFQAASGPQTLSFRILNDGFDGEGDATTSLAQNFDIRITHVIDIQGNTQELSHTYDPATNLVTATFPQGYSEIEITPGDYGKNLARTYYAVDVLSSENFVFQSRTRFGGSVTPVDGIYELAIAQANFQMTVTRPGPADFVETSNSWLDAELFFKGIDQTWYHEGWLWTENGKVFANLVNGGDYKIRVNALNDPTVAQSIFTFTVPEWTDPDGGAFPTPSSPLVVTGGALQVPNFKFAFTVGGVIQPERQIYISEPVGSPEVFPYNWIWTANAQSAESIRGVGAYRFPSNDEYSIFVPGDGILGTENTYFVATVANGVVTVDGHTANEGGDLDGVFVLPLKTNNLFLNVLKPGETPTALAGAYVEVFQETNFTRTSVASGSTNSNGNLSLSVPNGTYSMIIYPSSDHLLVDTNFTVTVLNGVVTNLVKSGASNSPDISEADEAYSLFVNTANFVGRIVDSVGNPLGSNQEDRVNLQLERFTAGNWDYVSGTSTNLTGLFGIYIPEVGEYRLRSQFEGHANVAETIFTPSALNVSAPPSSTVNLGDLVANSPNLTLNVKSPAGDAVPYAQVQVLQNGSFIGWFSANESGVVKMFLPPGTYEFEVNPPWDSDSGFVKSIFTAVVGASSTTINNVAATSFNLALSLPSIRGVVLSPTGDPVKYAQVMLVNSETGEDLWQFSANTNSVGEWALPQLPAGSYRLYARAPWGDVSFGNGPRSPIFTVASNGTINFPFGYSATNFELRLSVPAFSGLVVEPLSNSTNSSEPLADVSICLVPGNGDSSWNCVTSNSAGQWSLSRPDSFTGFATDSELVISDHSGRGFAEKRISGLAVEQVLTGGAGYSSTGIYAGIILAPAIGNLEITVKAGGNAEPGVWVSVDRDGSGWLGGAVTDSSGVARIFVADSLFGDLNVWASVDNNPGLEGRFSSTRKSFGPASSSGEVRSLSIDLTSPNFFGRVIEPGLGGNAVRDSWVEIIDAQTDEWMGGVRTNANGEFSATLPKAVSGSRDYRVSVNPAWNSSNFARSTYLVTVNSTGAGVVTSVASYSGAVAVDNGRYSLKLDAPNIRGAVRDNGVGVRDSWVVPIDNTISSNLDYLWGSGVNSGLAGRFSMYLPNGQYLLEANPPWNSTGKSRSARCQVTVGTVDSESVITAGDSACWNSTTNEVSLNLRAPNLKFKLVDSSGNPVRNASVGVGAGAWHAWSQSDRDGNVSLFIDATEIVTLNPQLVESSDSIDLHFWFDPPFGSGDLVRWDCSTSDTVLKPVCRDVPKVVKGSAASYLSTPLNIATPVPFATPNTRIRVTKPSGEVVGAGAWVSLFADRGTSCQGEMDWIAGGITDSSGLAAFNLSDAEKLGSYCVEVYPTWFERQTFAQRMHVVATYAGLNSGSFAVSAPNLSVTVLQSGDPTTARASRWAWIGVEEVTLSDGNYIPTRWVSGAGSDNRGLTLLSLAPSKTYRLTAYPGPGSSGSEATCVVSTNASGVVSVVTSACALGSPIANGAMTLSLSAGNVTGKVSSQVGTSALQNLSGAIVFAQAGDLTATAVTDAEGNYRMQLDPALSWTITVFTVTRPGDSIVLDSNTDGGPVTFSGGSGTKNVTVNATARS